MTQDGVIIPINHEALDLADILKIIAAAQELV